MSTTYTPSADSNKLLAAQNKPSHEIPDRIVVTADCPFFNAVSEFMANIGNDGYQPTFNANSSKKTCR